MPIYNIGYESEEDQKHTQFSFERDLTKTELTDYVHRATINALRYLLEYREKTEPDARSEKYDLSWESEKGPWFSVVYPRMIEELQLLGFKPLAFNAQWSCYGWDGIINPTTDERYICPENTLLSLAIPSDLKGRIQNISELEKSNRARDEIGQIQNIGELERSNRTENERILQIEVNQKNLYLHQDRRQVGEILLAQHRQLCTGYYSPTEVESRRDLRVTKQTLLQLNSQVPPPAKEEIEKYKREYHFKDTDELSIKNNWARSHHQELWKRLRPEIDRQVKPDSYTKYLYILCPENTPNIQEMHQQFNSVIGPNLKDCINPVLHHGFSYRHGPFLDGIELQLAEEVELLLRRR